MDCRLVTMVHTFMHMKYRIITELVAVLHQLWMYLVNQVFRFFLLMPKPQSFFIESVELSTLTRKYNQIHKFHHP